MMIIITYIKQADFLGSPSSQKVLTWILSSRLTQFFSFCLGRASRTCLTAVRSSSSCSAASTRARPVRPSRASGRMRRLILQPNLESINSIAKRINHPQRDDHHTFSRKVCDCLSGNCNLLSKTEKQMWSSLICFDNCQKFGWIYEPCLSFMTLILLIDCIKQMSWEP